MTETTKRATVLAVRVYPRERRATAVTPKRFGWLVTLGPTADSRPASPAATR